MRRSTTPLKPEIPAGRRLRPNPKQSMTRTGTTTEPHSVRNGKASLFPILRVLSLSAALLLFAIEAALAQSGYSGGSVYPKTTAQNGPSISSGLSSVSRPGSSIYTRKGTAASPLASKLSTPSNEETDAEDEKSSQVSSISVPRSPLAAARAAEPSQPKVVDDRLLSELSQPVPRPALSGAAAASRLDAPPSDRYSYFDDSDFDTTGILGDRPAQKSETAADRGMRTEPAPMTEFPELEKYDLPDELPPEPVQGFQAFAENFSSGALTSPAVSSNSAAPTAEISSSDLSNVASRAPSQPRQETSDTSQPTPDSGLGGFVELETFDVPAVSTLPVQPAETASLPESTAAAPESAAAEPAVAEPTAAVRYDSGFTVSDGSAGAESIPDNPKSAPLPKTQPADTGFADVETLDDPGSASVSPPEESEFPEFARNAYEALEPSEAELAGVIDREKGKPERERKSIAEKEEAERELKAEYDTWLAKQRADQKEKDKLPRYLQPLNDDRAVFESEDSPYARGKENLPAEEHKFVREISAADLTLMSEVSSNRELMDWEKEQDAPIDWSKYSASTLYNKWRDYIGMGPNEKEALAIMKKATLELMEWEKSKEPKTLSGAGELYEKAGKKWPDSILEEDALFYAGECAFFGKNYTKAKTFYKALLKKYSNSVLRRDAMERLYWIGIYWVKCAEEDPEVIGRFEGKERPRFSDFAGAKDAFETIFTNDVSDRGRAPDAVFALANAYMRRGVKQGDASFEEAAKYYQRLYEFYPACKYADNAYQLAMLALYQSYRGPFYDSTPLRRAEEIAKAAQRAHKGDQKVIEEQLRLIREKQAEYLLVRGEYYEKKKIYASARSYYQRLIDEFPDSEYAAKGAERYTAIRENPAESDQFALIRRVAPFLPESQNQYYEDQPTAPLSAAVQGEGEKGNDIANPDFSQLEKTAETERTEGGVR